MDLPSKIVMKSKLKRRQFWITYILQDLEYCSIMHFESVFILLPYLLVGKAVLMPPRKQREVRIGT